MLPRFSIFSILSIPKMNDDDTKQLFRLNALLNTQSKASHFDPSKLTPSNQEVLRDLLVKNSSAYQYEYQSRQQSSSMGYALFSALYGFSYVGTVFPPFVGQIFPDIPGRYLSIVTGVSGALLVVFKYLSDFFKGRMAYFEEARIGYEAVQMY